MDVKCTTNVKRIVNLCEVIHLMLLWLVRSTPNTTHVHCKCNRQVFFLYGGVFIVCHSHSHNIWKSSNILRVFSGKTCCFRWKTTLTKLFDEDCSRSVGQQFHTTAILAWNKRKTQSCRAEKSKSLFLSIK